MEFSNRLKQNYLTRFFAYGQIPSAKKQAELFGTAAMTFYLDFLGFMENARGMDASFVKEANCPMICNTYFIIYDRGIIQGMEI